MRLRRLFAIAFGVLGIAVSAQAQFDNVSVSNSYVEVDNYERAADGSLVTLQDSAYGIYSVGAPTSLNPGITGSFASYTNLASGEIRSADSSVIDTVGVVSAAQQMSAVGDVGTWNLSQLVVNFTADTDLTVSADYTLSSIGGGLSSDGSNGNHSVAALWDLTTYTRVFYVSSDLHQTFQLTGGDDYQYQNISYAGREWDATQPGLGLSDFQYDATSRLTLAATPEPSTCLPLALGGLGLVARRRFKGSPETKSEV